MKKRLTLWRFKAVGTAVLLLGSIGLSAMTVWGQQGPVGEHPEHGPVDTRNGLLARGRDRLAVCIQGVGIAPSVADMQLQVTDALASVASQHPQWVPAGFNKVPRSVQIGCPGDPHLLRDGVEYVNGRPGASNTGEGRLQTQTASPFRLYVFVLAPNELSRVIRGELNVRTAAQEMLCDGGRCTQVSTGLYLTAQELTDKRFLQEWVTKGLGLEPPFTLPGDPRPSTTR